MNIESNIPVSKLVKVEASIVVLMPEFLFTVY